MRVTNIYKAFNMLGIEIGEFMVTSQIIGEISDRIVSAIERQNGGYAVSKIEFLGI